MRNWAIKYSWITLLLLFFLSQFKADSISAQTSPTLNNGKKWNIGYLEGGPFLNYQGSLKSTIKAFMSMGWIEDTNIPEFPNLEDTRDLWIWLSDTAKSKYLNFPKDAYWSSNWKKEERTKNLLQIKNRIEHNKNIDLFIAMGTWAGQDLVQVLEKIPVIVMSCSDPVKAKIIKSEEDSGKDNVHAWCDPTRGERRLRLFHDILGFKRLGIIYENSEEGKLYADLSSIMKISRERDFKVIECEAHDTGHSLQECRENVSICIDKIAVEIDAFIISDHRGLHPKYFPEIIKPLFNKKVPVFTTIRGPILVQRGVMIGIAREDYQPLGNFYAKTITDILNGHKPRDLQQIYKEPLKLAINLETAKTIGYNIPPNVRGVADILYDKIDWTPLD